MALSCAVVGLARPTHAQSQQDKAKARTQMADGAKLLDRREYGPALAQFEEAYRLVPSPKILFNIGVAKRGLSRNAEALEAFERFLEQLPFAPAASRIEAEKARDELRQIVGFVEVNVDESGAAVSVDGRAVGVTPLRKLVPVDLGAHQIAVQKSEVVKRESVTIAVGGQKVVVSLQLSSPTQPAPRGSTQQAPLGSADLSRALPSPAIAAAAGTTTGAPAGSPATTADGPGTPSARSTFRALAPWMTAGAAVAAAGVGVAAWREREDKVRQYNSCGEKAVAAMMDLESCNGFADQTHSWQRWEVAAFVTAGVFTVATVTLLVLNSSSASQQSETHSAALECAPLFNSRGIAEGVTCGARF